MGYRTRSQNGLSGGGICPRHPEAGVDGVLTGRFPRRNRSQTARRTQSARHRLHLSDCPDHDRRAYQTIARFAGALSITFLLKALPAQQVWMKVSRRMSFCASRSTSRSGRRLRHQQRRKRANRRRCRCRHRRQPHRQRIENNSRPRSRSHRRVGKRIKRRNR